MQGVGKLFSLMVALAFGASIAIAGGPECQKAASCDKTKSASCSATACDVTKCMPQMTMMVGDKSFDCPMTAEDYAKQNGGTVVFAVAGKKFESREKAMAAYADVLDAFVADFAKVRTQEECMKSCSAAATCGDSAAKSACCAASKGQTAKATGTTGGECPAGKTVAAGQTAKAEGKTIYCVGGRCFDSKEKAEAAAKIVLAAMEEVKLNYRVGDEKFCCDKMAGEKAKATGKRVVYVVGDKSVECPVTARIQLDMAKVAAAAKALEKGGQV